MCIPLTNVLFAFGAALGVFADRPGYSDNCTVQNPVAPNGATSGNELLSDVAAFRIGDGTFASVPGETFPFTFLGSFLGPEDMPYPQYGLPAWIMPDMHTPYRFIDGLAEDMLGYMFPQGNGVGVPGEANDTNGTDRFGCGHSDDSESTGSQTADIVGQGLATLLTQNGGQPEKVVEGRYVLANGTLSRNAQGTPDSLKCNVDTTFAASAAVAVWEAGGAHGHVVHPFAWMSLSGRPQAAPDRNTRGWISSDGARHWLNVFPDITGAPVTVRV